ncbi:MAG: chemotaxis protein CheA, partial [Candidatus Riflebacteria bacterium]|nr:chemotaxis protein CheA [Candidatus Riflebacteria bacterium]
MDIDLSQYMGMYVDGSRENLDLMDKQLLALEDDPSNVESIGEIFRAAHTLKGMSATMGFEKVAHLTHEMENILDKLRNKQLEVHQGIIDLLFETFDVLRVLVNDSISATDSNVDLETISKKISEAAAGQGAAARKPEAQTIQSQPVAPTAAPAGAGGTGKPELADMAMNEFEMQVLLEAAQHQANIYYMKVQLVPDCLLKAPRAFMVARNLEELSCDIIKSVPETKDLEEEKFDLSFRMILLSSTPAADVQKGIESISEIEKVTVTPVTPDDFPRKFAGDAPAAPAPAPPQPPEPTPAPP